jgi:hypothetical protein
MKKRCDDCMWNECVAEQCGCSCHKAPVAPSRSAAPKDDPICVNCGEPESNHAMIGDWCRSESTDAIWSTTRKFRTASAAPPSEREALIAELKAARTAWHEDFGVPVSEEYARFLEAVGNLTDWVERGGMPDIIDQEIDWCESHRGIGKNADFEEGFVAGLKQAKFLQARAAVPQAAADFKYYKPPFEFREPKDEAGGPCIYDRDGHQIAMLFWPTHPVEETEAAEQETYRLGRMMAGGAAVPAPGTCEHPRCPRDYEGTSFLVTDKDGIFYVSCGVCKKFLGVWDGRFGHKLRDIPVAGPTAPRRNNEANHTD